jgi:hypothetical protein
MKVIVVVFINKLRHMKTTLSRDKIKLKKDIRICRKTAAAALGYFDKSDKLRIIPNNPTKSDDEGVYSYLKLCLVMNEVVARIDLMARFEIFISAPLINLHTCCISISGCSLKPYSFQSNDKWAILCFWRSIFSFKVIIFCRNNYLSLCLNVFMARQLV